MSAPQNENSHNQKNLITLRLGDEISIKDLGYNSKILFFHLLKKWKTVLFIGIIGGGIGIVYSIYRGTFYVSKCTFVLEDTGSGGNSLGQYAGLASAVGIDLNGTGGGGIFQGDNLLELYKSRTMIEKALLTPVKIGGKNVLLIDRYLDITDRRKLWAGDMVLSKLKFKPSDSSSTSRVQDSIISNIVDDINKNYLTVNKPDKKLGIIQVLVKSKDEVFSKEFNNTIVETVNNFFIQTKTKKSNANLFILQHQADSVKKVLYGAIETAAFTIDITPNLNNTRQSLRTPIQKSQMQAEANKVILSELVKNLELAKVTVRKETPLIQVIDSPVYPLEKDRLGKGKSAVIFGMVFGLLTSIIIVLKAIL